MIDLYEITNLISGVLGTYVIYKLMHIFFDELNTDKRTEILSYIGYYVLSSLAFFIARIPLVMMVLNIILFFSLTFNYSASMKRKLMFSFLAYMLLMSIEVLVSVVTGYFSIPVFGYTEYGSVIGMVMIRVVSLLVVNLLAGFKDIKNDIPVPNFYWISTIFISTGSLFQLITFLNYGNITKNNAAVFLTVVVGTNFLVLFLYDYLNKLFNIKTEKLLLIRQTRMYEKQLAIIQESVKSAQIVKHDIKNHMIALKFLYKNNDISNVDNYIDNIISSVDNKSIYSNSGNVIIDSILNFKLQAIQDMDISVDIEINVPEKLRVSPFDLTAILGNLIDNAITALKQSSQEEKIFIITIKYSKGNIIIGITNSFEGEIRINGSNLETLKEDKKNHGFGLKSVEEAVQKNGGYIDLDFDDRIFKVKVIIPSF